MLKIDFDTLIAGKDTISPFFGYFRIQVQIKISIKKSEPNSLYQYIELTSMEINAKDYYTKNNPSCSHGQVII